MECAHLQAPRPEKGKMPPRQTGTVNCDECQRKREYERVNRSSVHQFHLCQKDPDAIRCIAVLVTRHQFRFRNLMDVRRLRLVKGHFVTNSPEKYARPQQNE